MIAMSYFPFFFGFFLNAFKSAPVILSRGSATAASFFCFGEYFEYGIISSFFSWLIL